VSAQRLEDRKDLLSAFDVLRRDLDSKGTIKGIDAFQARALRLVDGPDEVHRNQIGRLELRKYN